jgi:hypothetical protein
LKAAIPAVDGAAQFKEMSTQVVVAPAEYESGKLIYPYKKANSDIGSGLCPFETRAKVRRGTPFRARSSG